MGRPISLAGTPMPLELAHPLISLTYLALLAMSTVVLVQVRRDKHT